MFSGCTIFPHAPTRKGRPGGLLVSESRILILVLNGCQGTSRPKTERAMPYIHSHGKDKAFLLFRRSHEREDRSIHITSHQQQVQEEEKKR